MADYTRRYNNNNKTAVEKVLADKLLGLGELKSEYIKHQIEDNYHRFLMLPILTCLIGLAFLGLNSYHYFYSELALSQNDYYVIWLLLIVVSLGFRVFISTVNKNNNYQLLNYSMFAYATIMCCLAASVTALDLQTGHELTAYSYTILGMATAYRTSLIKYTIMSVFSFCYFIGFCTLVLGYLPNVVDILSVVVLTMIAVFIAVSLELNRKKMITLSAQLEASNRRLREESIRDPLTKLYNRRYLTDYLMRKVKEFARSRESLCVAVCDLDHFKKINDELGHLVGDQALFSFAQLLQQVGRETDIHIRFGGEEFVIVMPKTTLAQALVSIERLREATLRHSFQNIPWPISASVGLTEIRPEDDYNSLLARADAFVYEAKARGRNQIVVG